jgi:catechol 2,3-dioxygenase-like lactoylglutathione lyase family enzyme
MAATTCSCCGKTGEPTVQLHAHREIQICDDCLHWLNAKRNEQMNAHGGAWRAEGFEPIFVVADVARSCDHYAKLGFEISQHDDTYAFAHRDRDLTIHLTNGEEGDVSGGSSLYIHCANADELADEWRKAGLVVTGPKDEEYGKREGSHADPDGNLIRFGSPLR